MKKPTVIIIVGVLLAIMFLPYITSGSLFDDFSTQTYVSDIGGVETAVYFSKTDYAGTWRTDRLSESFTVTSKANHNLVRSSNMEEYRYALYVDGTSSPLMYYPSSDWLDMPNVFVNQWIWLEPWNVEGIPNIVSDTLRMVVVMEWKGTDLLTGLIWTTHDNPDACSRDGAVFHTGEASITLPTNKQGPFEEGSKVDIIVRTGWDTDNSWAVKIYPPADRTDLDQTGQILTTLTNDVYTTVSWTVPSGAFKVGSDNAWIAEIWNTYFGFQWTRLLTIDDIERMPIITDVTPVNNGDSMTYTVTCEQTYASLSHIKVYAWYGDGQSMPMTSDVQSWVIFDLNVPISSTTATFTVNAKAGIDGNVMVNMVAYDVEGRPSEQYWQAFMDLGDEIDVVPPPIEQPFIWTTTALIIAVLIALAVLAVLTVAPIPIEIKIVLTIVLSVAGAYLVWLAGTFQLGG